jgi:hypothetical protein
VIPAHGQWVGPGSERCREQVVLTTSFPGMQQQDRGAR